MKLKMQVTTVAGQVLARTVEVPKMDITVAAKKAVLSLGLEMSDVSAVHTMPQ